MKLLLNTLPSGGFCKSSRKDIELKPLTYREIRKYSSRKYPTAIEKLVWDMEHMVMTIDGWEDLSAYDITSIIFMRKYTSATFKPTLKVTVKEKTYDISIADIHFKSLTDDIKNLEEVHVNGAKFRFEIPTASKYYTVLKTLSPQPIYQDDEDLPTINLATCLTPIDMYESETYDPVTAFNIVYPIINSATQADITVLEAVSDLFNDRFNDVTIYAEGGETAVRISSLTADMFRFIQLNSGDVSNRIVYKQEV